MSDRVEKLRRQANPEPIAPSPFDPVALEERLKVARAQRAAALANRTPASDAPAPAPGKLPSETALGRPPSPSLGIEPDLAPPGARRPAPSRGSARPAERSTAPPPAPAPQVDVAAPLAPKAPPLPAKRSWVGPASLGLAFAAGITVAVLASGLLRTPAVPPPSLATAAPPPDTPSPQAGARLDAPPAEAPNLTPTELATSLAEAPRVSAEAPALARPTPGFAPEFPAPAASPAVRPEALAPSEAPAPVPPPLVALAPAPPPRPSLETAAPAPDVAAAPPDLAAEGGPVTVHAPGLTPDETVSAATGALSAAGFSPNPPVRVNFVIGRTHVRYYHAADSAAAATLAAALPDGPVEVRDFTDAPTRAAPGTLEIWLAGSPRAAAVPRRAPPPAPAPEPALAPIGVTPLPPAPAPGGPPTIVVTPLPPAPTTPPSVTRQVEGAIRNFERALGNTLDRVTRAP